MTPTKSRYSRITRAVVEGRFDGHQHTSGPSGRAIVILLNLCSRDLASAPLATLFDGTGCKVQQSSGVDEIELDASNRSACVPRLQQGGRQFDDSASLIMILPTPQNACQRALLTVTSYRHAIDDRPPTLRKVQTPTPFPQSLPFHQESDPRNRCQHDVSVSSFSLKIEIQRK